MRPSASWAIDSEAIRARGIIVLIMVIELSGVQFGLKSYA